MLTKHRGRPRRLSPERHGRLVVYLSARSVPLVYQIERHLRERTEPQSLSRWIVGALAMRLDAERRVAALNGHDVA